MSASIEDIQGKSFDYVIVGKSFLLHVEGGLLTLCRRRRERTYSDSEFFV